MSAPGTMKQDAHAARYWGGDLYDAIPKSVFATVAWHLANAASGNCDADSAAELAFEAELRALIGAGIVPPQQGKRVLIALEKDRG